MKTTNTSPPTFEGVRSELQSLKNLDAFAKVSNIPRRTLMRVKNGEEKSPRLTTLLLIDLALKKHRPARTAKPE